MKKTLLSLLAAAAVVMTSCSSKVSDQKADDEGEAIRAKIENCTDPDSLKIYVQQAQDYAAKLEKQGNDTAARAYLEAVAPAVKAKDASAYDAFRSLVEKADSGATAEIAKADSIKDVAADKIKDAAGKAKGAAGKASDAVTSAASKASDAVSGAASKAKEAIGAK